MKRIKKLYIRNFAITAALLLISFILLGIAFVFLTFRLTLNEKKETMVSNASEVIRMATAFSLNGNIWDFELRMSISTAAESADMQFFLTDATGQVVSCSEKPGECNHEGQTIPASILNTITAEGEFYDVTNLNGILSESSYVVGLPMGFDDGSALMGYVFVISTKSNLTFMWKQTAIIFIIVAFLVLLLAFAISMLTAREEAKPLRDMAQAAHRFAHGDFDARVEDTGRNDEIGELTRAFNFMAESLELSEQKRNEFIANVSHELKTPMTTITGFADGLLDGTIPPEHQTEYLTTISNEAKRMSRLVRKMLDTSRVQAMDTTEILKGSFDISEVIRISLLSLEGKINSRNLDVNVLLPDDEIIVRGDKDSITQVVYNLIENASKFANPGSCLIISLQTKGDKAYISVKDEGAVIPSEELPLIFDRFHKTDKSRSEDKDGVGLGLYIVKTIINNHNEDITVTSVNGITEFIFTLTLKT